MLNYFHTQAGQLLPIADYQRNCWVHVEQPTVNELNQLQTRFTLPSDYLTAVLDDKENPRAEGIHHSIIEQPALILLRFPHETVSPLGYNEYTTFPFAIILTAEALITISNHSAPFIQDFLLQQTQLNTSNHERFALQLIWFINKYYLDCLDENSRAMDELEKTLSLANENNDLFQLTAMQKSLIRFQTALHKNRQLLANLQASKFYFETAPFIKLLRDILIESEQAATTTIQQKQIIDEYNTTVSSIVSNNLNIIMKVLTSITIILTIPTIIGGIYGMNVHLPGAASAHAFAVIIFGTLIVSWLAAWWLRHRHFF
ncbi:magnesium transporter CorA family protein [Loigolactobacillus jiayinensis]|uniref:Magnesium transporter CorA family protein n=1 Tax=Loigolactobacillus jiayinensis TaxID=2486016 RepID=A0ABW1RH02_9LACO|nr:magnesium transporter CorA family protein [Loigolactobacillus jiayinensis]